jgi:hypothetical protein
VNHRYPKLSISGFEITVNVWDFPYWSNFEKIILKLLGELHFSDIAITPSISSKMASTFIGK